MRKLLLMVLCLMMVCAAGSALADDAALREAVDGEKTIVLTKTELVMPGGDARAQPIGISPDGQTVIWRTDQGFFLSRSGEVTPIHAAPERGTGDPYKKLGWELEALSWVMPPEEGLAWSPDGRYVLLCSRQLALQRVMALDLIVLDAMTGEVFPVLSFDGGSMARGDFSTSLQSRDFGMVIEARFDATGKYIWFIGRINAFSETFSLFRFSMETGRTELMLEDFGIGIMDSSLNLLRSCDDGWLLMVSNDNDSRETRDVWIRFDPEESSRIFSGDTARGSVLKAERGFLQGKFLGLQALLSPETGNGLVLVVALDAGPVSLASTASSQAADLAKASINPLALVIPRLNRITRDEADPNTYWELRRDPTDPDSLYLRECDPAFIDLLERYTLTGEMPEAEKGTLSAYSLEVAREDPPSICCISLSPGGEFALLCLHDDRSKPALFFMLDIEAMTLYPVENPEGLEPVHYGKMPLVGRFPPGIVWNEDGTLLILNGNTVQAFRLEIR